MQNVSFEPAFTDLSDADLTLRPFSVRRAGTFVIHANRGDHVTLRLRQLQVGRYSGKPMAVTLLTPSGKKLPLGKVPFPEEAAFEFDAAETGLFRIPFECGANKAQITAANRPACVSGEERRIPLIAARGDFFFYVPEDTKEFGVRIAGEGEREAVAAAIYDPTGQKVWERPAITDPEQFVTTPESSQTGKPWRLTFARPVGHHDGRLHRRAAGDSAIPHLHSESPAQTGSLNAVSKRCGANLCWITTAPRSGCGSGGRGRGERGL